MLYSELRNQFFGSGSFTKTVVLCDSPTPSFLNWWRFPLPRAFLFLTGGIHKTAFTRHSWQDQRPQRQGYHKHYVTSIPDTFCAVSYACVRIGSSCAGRGTVAPLKTCRTVPYLVVLCCTPERGAVEQISFGESKDNGMYCHGGVLPLHRVKETQATARTRPGAKSIKIGS